MMDRTFVVTLTLCAFAACTRPSAPEPKAAEAEGKARAEIGEWGFDTTGMTDTVAPGEDFDTFANGAWKARTEIPADRSSIGTFVQLRIEAEDDIHAILQDLADEKQAPGSLEEKVGMAFGAWMDVEAINARGAEPLAPYLAEIAALDSKGALLLYNVLHSTLPYGVGIIPNPADTTQYIAFVAQSGLGLPEREFYLKDDPRMQEYRAAYLDYIETLLTLAGIEGGDEKAKAIMELETEIAQVHWTQAESRDIKKIYNPMSLEQLAELAPQFSFRDALAQLGLSSVPTFVVAQPSAIERAGEVIDGTDLETLKAYVAFHFVRNHATQLAADFDDAHFELYQKTLNGVKEKRARWKRGVELINDGLGEAVGQIYVERHFPPDAKRQMDELVANLQAALKQRIENNAWMDAATKEQALKKLATFEPRIGYPTKWTDYGPLAVTDNAFENARAIVEFGWNEQVKRLGGPVDREIWGYPPQTVNASYNPLLNQITFPAGILQPPFFDPGADPAINYGGIGAVIGHEIGHGFDDQGRRFDESGKIRDWWTPEADAAYTELTEQLGAQFAEYEPVDGMNINPKLTMGENIGDLGGLQMAYAAYHRYLDSCCGGEAPVIDGMTGDQRFFLGWAQVWRALYTEDALRQRVLTDPHSPPRFRINGIVRNMDPWYAAFGVKEGDALYLAPEQRVVIW